MIEVKEDRAFAGLLAWRHGEIARIVVAGGDVFLGLPEAWMDDPHFGCVQGHVSTRIVKTDRGDRCPACDGAVVMIPAMDEPTFSPIAATARRTS
jgi:hypothetical protein